MQAYVIVPPQGRLCSIAPVPLSPATVTASQNLRLASCAMWTCRVEKLGAHLSGCLDLNQNFCKSATVSQAKPTKNAAPAAYPSGPKALAGASVCKLPAGELCSAEDKKHLGFQRVQSRHRAQCLTC